MLIIFLLPIIFTEVLIIWIEIYSVLCHKCLEDRNLKYLDEEIHKSQPPLWENSP